MQRFQTLRQVEDTLWRQRHRIGGFPYLSCRLADGPGTTRLYFLSCYQQGPISAQQFAWWSRPALGLDYFGAQRMCNRVDNLFEATEECTGVRTWFQGGLDRAGVLQWADAVLVPVQQ